MNPISSISNLSGDLLIAVIAGLVFIEESGVPVPFAPGDLLLMIAGIAIASGTVDPAPMIAALLIATVIGAMIGREIFATVGQPALMKVADTLRFRRALERAIHLLRRGGAPAVSAGLVPSVLVYITFFVGLGALVGQPAVRLFHRAEHRFFVIAVTTLATLAVVLSVRWLARRGALTALEPIVLAVRRNLADSIEARLFHDADDQMRQVYPLIRRLWAALVDLTLTFGLTVLILTAVSGLDTTEVVLDPQGLLLLAGVALVYRVPYEARTGQTLGKLLMGISVYGPEGGVPGWWRAALRNVIGGLVVVWPIDAVLLLRRGRRQRLGDLAVRATVRRVST